MAYEISVDMGRGWELVAATDSAAEMMALIAHLREDQRGHQAYDGDHRQQLQEREAGPPTG